MKRLKVVVIVQARMGSSRLPGKVLLSAAGKPMLAHQIDRMRQVRRAHQIVIATSRHEKDNAIVEFGSKYGVPVYCGSETDVLSRFAEAAAAYDADVIVRLTGDCPLIDPGIVDNVIADFLHAPSDLCYVSNTLERTYPRGMDTEVFSRSLLEWANTRAITPYDREHVTAFMVHDVSGAIARRNVVSEQNLSAYRVTLDYRKDFVQLSRLLNAGLPDYSWRTVLSRAAELGLNWHDNPERPKQLQQVRQQKQRKKQQQRPLSRFGLGTAQFGMFYGNFNKEGVPSRGAVRDILKRAYELGLTVVDTARQYGESEFVLGHCHRTLAQFDVITKTPAFSNEQITAADVRALREAFDVSLHFLQVPSINGLLVHHASNLLAPGGELLYEELLRLKQEGRIHRIGISDYSGDAAERVVERFPVDLVQLPINLLDHRLLETGTLSRLAQRGIEIHARSVFLQGLLLANPATLPSHFHSIRETLAAFHVAARDAGVSPAHAALHFVLGLPEISRIIVGVESLAQLNDLFGNFPDTPAIDYRKFKIDEVEILNPVFWVK